VYRFSVDRHKNQVPRWGFSGTFGTLRVTTKGGLIALVHVSGYRERLERYRRSSAEGATAPETLRQKDRYHRFQL
jgi:hypothetical protein